MEMKTSAILLRHSSVDRTFITVEYEIKLNELDERLIQNMNHVYGWQVR